MPGKVSDASTRSDFFPTKEEITKVHGIFCGDFRIPLNFQQTAPPQTFQGDAHDSMPPTLYYRFVFQNISVRETNHFRNPQSTIFCDKLSITDLNELFANAAFSENCLGIPHYYVVASSSAKTDEKTADETSKVNPDEIDLGDSDDVS
jgi:hypothetical protein